MPDVPTLAEAGFPGVGSLNWNGLFAPVRTPRPIVSKLYDTAVAAMKELDADGTLSKRQLPVSLSAFVGGFAEGITIGCVTMGSAAKAVAQIHAHRGRNAVNLISKNVRHSNDGDFSVKAWSFIDDG